MEIFFLYLLLVSMVEVSECQGTCPILSTVSVDLSATFEKDGRKFACPGDQVTFTCRTFLSTSVRIVAENFICRSTPVIYIATDPVGSSGPTSATDVFQANLTEVQRDSNQPLVANFTATLEANVTNETADTVVECFGQQTFSCDVLRKNLSQSEMPSPPPELRYRINSTNCECDRLDIDSTPMNCTCQNNELVLFWGQASGNFDVQHYTVGISGAENNTTTNVSSTFFSVHVTSGLKYCVHVSTVSMCDQMSDAAVPEDSMDGCINIGFTVTLPGPVRTSLYEQWNIIAMSIGVTAVTVTALLAFVRYCCLHCHYLKRWCNCKSKRRSVKSLLMKWLSILERVFVFLSFSVVIFIICLLFIQNPCSGHCQRGRDTAVVLFCVFSVLTLLTALPVTIHKLFKKLNRCNDESPKYVTLADYESHRPIYVIYAKSATEPRSVRIEPCSARVAPDSSLEPEEPEYLQTPHERVLVFQLQKTKTK